MSLDPKKTGGPPRKLELKKLTAEQIRQIDETLVSLEGSGQVRLIVQRGELRFINKVEVHPADDIGEEE